MASTTLQPSVPPPFYYILSLTCQTKNPANVWGKHGDDESLKKDAKCSEARKNWGTSVNERAINCKKLNF